MNNGSDDWVRDFYQSPIIVLFNFIDQFRVFELSPRRLPTVDLFAITNTTWQREKAAGADSSDLRPIWLPTLDNLRNFLLTSTADMLSFFQQGCMRPRD
jgi:hypothetical protein